MDRYAFQGCSSMTDLVIGNGVQIVKTKAFSGCSSLQNITIGTGVKEFESGAFEQCNSNTIKNIYISDLTKWCNIKFGSITSNPFCYVGYMYLNGEKVTDLEIPSGVTAIKDYAFMRCIFEGNLIIPSSVKSIGYYSFYLCSRMKEVVLPEGLQSIG
jgi:hypothetical protein